MSGNEETFIIGNYDGEKRKREILEQFQKMLDEASKDIAKFREELLKGPREDVCLWYMKAKKIEADDVKVEIDCFDNPDGHFTKQYRTFQGHCGKIQTDLDGVDVLGRDDLKDLRKDVLETIDNMIKALQKKVHKDGKPCPNCQVQQ